MIANLATTAIAESLVLKSRSNHNGLAVSDEFGWNGKKVFQATCIIGTLGNSLGVCV